MHGWRPLCFSIMLADVGCGSVMAAATVEQALSLIEARDFVMLDMNLNGDKTYVVARSPRVVCLSFSRRATAIIA